jgi:glycosyltransferase involved in cell wall biosynthesis
MLVGITRVRNEALIIEDTLRHFLDHVDQVLMYDDCSTDETVAIAAGIDRVTVINGDEWRPDRVAENTRHRALLLALARKVGADWCLCFDADERLEGELPPLDADGYRFRLFDGYLTPDLQAPYTGGDLAALPRRWGPEYRDIVMLFRPDAAAYDQPGQRQPTMHGRVEDAGVMVRHYGKCLSVAHWDETCRYYIDHFPRWRVKWQARLGHAIHGASDFGRPLVCWDGLPAVAVPL